MGWGIVQKADGMYFAYFSELATPFPYGRYIVLNEFGGSNGEVDALRIDIPEIPFWSFILTVGLPDIQNISEFGNTLQYDRNIVLLAQCFYHPVMRQRYGYNFMKISFVSDNVAGAYINPGSYENLQLSEMLLNCLFS